MCNYSLYTGIFPDRPKLEVLKPLHKKETKLVLQIQGMFHYYLPSEVFQKVIYDSHHLHTNNIPVTEQCGFRKDISTENPAFRLTDSVFKSANQKCMLEEFTVTYKKVFDF